MRHLDDPRFVALIVREYLTDIKQAGGIWSEAEGMYPLLQGRPNKQEWVWRFPSGAEIKFGHLDGEYQKRYRGAQIVGLYFEEMADLGEEEVWFLIGRNRRRSGCRVRPYVRGTCNPDADSWLAPFLQWWWDPATGYAIQERSGRVRWVARRGASDYLWADTRAQLLAQHPEIESDQCKSVQFIAASVDDNPYQAGYRGNLLNLDEVLKERLLRGNWKIRYRKGSVFRREWFLDEHGRPRTIREIPDDVVWCRAWDPAATSEAEAGHGDFSYTAGVLIGRVRSTGRIILGPLVHGRWDAGEVDENMKETTHRDRQRFGHVRTWICREGAGAGKAQLQHYVKMLAGFEVDGDRESGDKTIRLAPLSAQAKHRNVVLLEDASNDKLLALLDSLPAKKAEDVGDAAAAAFEQVAHGALVLTGEQIQEVVAANPALLQQDQGGPRLGLQPRADLGRGRFRL